MSYVAVLVVSKPGRVAWMRVGAPVGPQTLDLNPNPKH
jgi:hypothetical protein